jgi:hypothetical protein
LNNTVDSLTETIAVNNTIYRVPVLYIPDNAIPGTYRFRATVSYQDVQVWGEATFTVRLPGPVTTTTVTTTVPVTTTTVIGTTTTVTTTIPERRRRDVSEDVTVPLIPPIMPLMKREISIYRYPYEVYAYRGEVKPLFVIIENTGDLTLDDVTVFIGGAISVDKVIPEEIDNVEPGSRRSFIIDISVPSGLAAGEYYFTLKAIAEHTSDERYIRFIVLEKPPEPERDLKRQIEELDKLLDDIWSETVETGLTGKNVLDIFRSLKDAKDRINDANRYWMNMEYDKTRTAIDDARDYMEVSVIGLAIARPEIKRDVEEVFSTKEITIYALPVLYWIFAIIAILVIVFLIYGGYKKSRPGKNLEERYELLRMRDRILGGGKIGAGHAKDTGLRAKKIYSDKAVLNILKNRIKSGK